MTEPTVRRDGTCLVCKGPRPFTPQRSVPDYEYLGDPFCSRKCSEKFFGTEASDIKPTKHGVLESEGPPV
jgi:hypothetical protein